MEGSSVNHVYRILAGQQLYVQPSIDFVPFGYAPLYFYFSAVVAKIVGLGFFPLRLVSVSATLGCLILIFVIVKRDTKSAYCGIIAAGLFAATYRIVAYWFDVGRVDSLFLFFLMASIYLVLYSNTVKTYILAGMLISCSFFTKQTCLVIFIPLLLYYLVYQRQKAFFLIGTMITVIGFTTLILNYLHDGWFNYYIFELPRQRLWNHLLPHKILSFWTVDILREMPVAFVLTLYYSYSQRHVSEKRDRVFIFLGLVVASWIARLELGGFLNNLIPAYAAIAIGSGLAIHTTFQFIKSLSVNKRMFIEAGIYLFLILQFFSLRYDISDNIPNQKDLESGYRYLSELKQLKGKILVPTHTYLTRVVGKGSSANILAVNNILTANIEPVKEQLIDNVRQAITGKRYDTIVLDRIWFEFQKDIENHYTLVYEIPKNSKTVFMPGKGHRLRTKKVYKQKNKKEIGEIIDKEAGTRSRKNLPGEKNTKP